MSKDESTVVSFSNNAEREVPWNDDYKMPGGEWLSIRKHDPLEFEEPLKFEGTARPPVLPTVHQTLHIRCDCFKYVCDRAKRVCACSRAARV